MNRLVVLAAAAAMATCTSLASAGVIRSPVAVVADTMGTAGGSTTHIIDQSGLSATFVSGATDFATYIGGGPTHAVDDATNAWAGNGGPALGYLEFDLGSEFAISSFVIWTQNNNNSVDSFTLISANDAAFTSGVTTLGTFTAVVGLNAQTFAVAGVGRFVRLQVNSNYGGANVNIGEVAFQTGAAPLVSAASIPALDGRALAALALLLGLTGLFAARRRGP